MIAYAASTFHSTSSATSSTIAANSRRAMMTLRASTHMDAFTAKKNPANALRLLVSSAGLIVFNLFMAIPAAVCAALLVTVYACALGFYVSGIAITASGLAGANELILNNPLHRVERRVDQPHLGFVHRHARGQPQRVTAGRVHNAARCTRGHQAQVCHLDVAVGRENARAFDDVAQLAHVAGPVVGLQQRQGLGGHPAQRPVVPRAEFVEKRLHQQRHIVTSSAQGLRPPARTVPRSSGGSS